MLTLKRQKDAEESCSHNNSLKNDLEQSGTSRWEDGEWHRTVGRWRVASHGGKMGSGTQADYSQIGGPSQEAQDTF